MAALAIKGMKVTVAGRLTTMSHSEFAALVEAQGGVFQSGPTRTTSLVVVGQLPKDSATELERCRGLVLAQRYRSAGYPIQLCNEDEFLASIEAHSDVAVHRRMTLRQLSRVLSVPEQRLRSWARLGLIEPSEIVHRLAWFDFGQVAQAKRLGQLIDSGATIADIRHSLLSMSAWLDTERVLSRLTVASRGRLVARLETGQLIEPTGQLCFDFDVEADGQALCSWDRRTADDWFHIAVEAEDAGDFTLARDAYYKAVALDETDPVLLFNLGNVLYELNELQSAAAAFQEAVRLDSRYAEAWNNFGNVLAELGDREAAIAAFDHALALVPNYEDAKQNRFHVMGLSPLMQADLRLAGK